MEKDRLKFRCPLTFSSSALNKKNEIKKHSKTNLCSTGNPQPTDPNSVSSATNVDICIESSSSSYPHQIPEHSVVIAPPPPIHHYSHAAGHHYHHPQPIHPTPTCGGDYKGHYTSVAPSQPPSTSISDGRSSAFCAPGMQQPHHEISGKFFFRFCYAGIKYKSLFCEI